MMEATKAQQELQWLKATRNLIKAKLSTIEYDSYMDAQIKQPLIEKMFFLWEELDAAIDAQQAIVDSEKLNKGLGLL